MRFRRVLAVGVLAATASLVVVACHNPNHIVISGNVTLGETTVDSGKTLELNPYASTTVRMTGNLIVKGTLRMRPASPDVRHRIIFTTADESAFVGSTSTPVSTDQGLWVLEGGRLDLAGTPREPWARATATVPAGATSVTLDRDPFGWRVGDRIILTPTGRDEYDEGFESREITAISGRQISVNLPFETAHPAVSVPSPPGGTATAEVLNIARNVRIEGKKPAAQFPREGQANKPGRTHVFIRNTTPVQHTIDYVAIRRTGPRQFHPPSGGSRYVLGRYGLHFHHSGDNNRGTTVTGTVVFDAGSHAFVPHTSHGITFRRTIAYDTAETPYWWDVKANAEGYLTNATTHDIRYEETVAARVSDQDPTPRRAGYSAACGSGNAIVGAVAVGVGGEVQTSGILWPEGANDCPNTWLVADNVAHNNGGAGFFIWQNDHTDPHNATFDFVAYRNGGACIEHGAYRNAFDFARVTCADGDGGFHPASNPNRHAGVAIHALSPASDPSNFDDFVIRSDRVPNALRILSRLLPGDTPTSLRRWDVGGYTDRAVNVAELHDGTAKPGAFDFICWTLPGGAELEPSDFAIEFMDPDSVYRVQQRDGDAYRIMHDGTTNVIAPFEQC